jgi:hypothetical protein
MVEAKPIEKKTRGVEDRNPEDDQSRKLRIRDHRSEKILVALDQSKPSLEAIRYIAGVPALGIRSERAQCPEIRMKGRARRSWRK